MARFTPHGNPGTNSVTLFFRATKDMQEELEAHAELHKISISDLVRQMIVHCLKELKEEVNG